MVKLPKILLNESGGDTAFLIDGYKMPWIAPEYEIESLSDGVVRVTVTFLADEVTVLSRAARQEAVHSAVSAAFCGWESPESDCE